EVSAGELLDVAIARAEAVNPKINAIVHKQYEQARATIGKGLPNGPLAGVPYLIKDLAIFQAGEPARLGSNLYTDFIADHDSSYTARCKRAGLVIMGRSSTPGFGISPSTEPRLFGPCRNPWNLAHSAGGSSGGAAAAVAGGILTVAHASDGGGSIPIPAAQCGLLGLKPSRGRMSFGPDVGEGWGGMSTAHVVCRSVRDCAVMLDSTAGAEPGDPYTAPPPEHPFVEEIKRPPGRLKVAMMRKDHVGAGLHPECLAAVEKAGKLCESLGHLVEEGLSGFGFRRIEAEHQTDHQYQYCGDAMQQIAGWLEKLGMSEYAQRFAENRIDLSVLRDLTDQDPKDLGVVLGDRRRMLRAIAEFGGG